MDYTFFKVGDKVTSVRPETEEERSKYPSWIQGMDKSVNYTGEIIKIRQHSYLVSFNGKRYSYHHEWLRPAKIKKIIG